MWCSLVSGGAYPCGTQSYFDGFNYGGGWAAGGGSGRDYPDWSTGLPMSSTRALAWLLVASTLASRWIPPGSAVVHMLRASLAFGLGGADRRPGREDWVKAE